jgi:hypothetical protein
MQLFVGPESLRIALEVTLGATDVLAFSVVVAVVILHSDALPASDARAAQLSELAFLHVRTETVHCVADMTTIEWTLVLFVPGKAEADECVGDPLKALDCDYVVNTLRMDRILVWATQRTLVAVRHIHPVDDSPFAGDDQHTPDARVAHEMSIAYLEGRDGHL